MRQGLFFVPPVEDLDDPLRLDIPANDPVQLPASGLVRQVQAVLVKEFMLLALAGLGAVRALILGWLRRDGLAPVGIVEELVEEGERRRLAVGLVGVVLVALGLLREHLAKHIRHFVVDMVQVLVGACPSGA